MAMEAIGTILKLLAPEALTPKPAERRLKQVIKASGG
jgi:hypothetical protein